MLASGTILQGRYEIECLLGQGGFGAVYQAKQMLLRRRVAIKETLFNDDPAHVSRFEQEAELLARVDHRALPGVMDYFQEAGCSYLVMQCIPGEYLGECVTRQSDGYVSEAEALRIISPILDALEYLHSQD